MRQTKLPSSRLAEGVWGRFLEQYTARLNEFRREIVATWLQLSNDLESLRDRFEEITLDLEPDRLSSLRACYFDQAESLLTDPVNARLQLRPQARSLTALHNLTVGCENVLRVLPRAVGMSNRDLSKVLHPSLGSHRVPPWAAWGKKPKPVPLRRLVADQMQSEALRRMTLDGSFQLLLAQASIQLLGPWHAFRFRCLEYLVDPEDRPTDIDSLRKRWIRGVERFAAQGAEYTERYTRWCDEAAARLTEYLLNHPAPLSDSKFKRNGDKLHKCLDYWSRQQRGVQTVLELELQIASASRATVEVSGESTNDVERENRDLAAELDGVIHVLDRGEPDGMVEAFPEQKARLISAENRVRRLSGEIERIVQRELPVTVEAVEPTRALPGLRAPWKELAPVDVALRALRGTSQESMLDGFQEVTAVHQAVIREVERAREIVAFSAEVARQEGEEGQAIGIEGIANAAGMLRYQQENAPEVLPIIERGLTRGLASFLLECHISIEQGRLGLIRHLIEETSQRGVRRLWFLGVYSARRSFFAGARQLDRLWTKLLYVLGWKAPPAPPVVAVFQTPRLEETLELPLMQAELPRIYRRLFRLDPVEDPRFLIGRDAELSGVIEARKLWGEGRPASVIVVGARGSGKTSLLTCARKVALQGLTVAEGYFQERILTRDAMRQFLRDLLDLPADSVLEDELAANQRVVILEEMERTFLRRIGGFQALRYLLELISRTSRTTLWILSLNEDAARFLNLTNDLDRYFSHRINAMAVHPGDLQKAILMRHNLSGYRLGFAPPDAGDPRVSQFRKRLGLERDAQEHFFDSLYRMSQGVFRSSFQLWQHQIERVEGGVVHLRQPAEPDFSRLRRVLTLDDCFTLQAVQQHGGLNQADLAGIFQESEDSGRERIERLLALEILQPDPRAPGYRVRPEAGMLVREALHGQNL